MTNQFTNKRVTNSLSEKLSETSREVTPRHWDILIKLITAFFDSELALSAGLASVLNLAPNITQYINVSHVILEKTANAQAIFNIVGELDRSNKEFINRLKNFQDYDWAARVARKTLVLEDVALQKDRRVAIHYYPVENWLDAVMMYVLQEKAGHILTNELANVFHQPLGRACEMVMTYERVHASIARQELFRLADEARKNGQSDNIQAAFDYWLPRARAIFDLKTFPYFEELRALGMRHRSNKEMLADFDEKAQNLLLSLQAIKHL